MNEAVTILAIALVTAIPLYVSGLLAERIEVPHRVLSAALQLAAGILTAIVAFTLMPPAVEDGPPVAVVLAFFVGGALFVVMNVLVARQQASGPSVDPKPYSVGFFLGVIVDMAIDGMAIGIGSTQSLSAGLVLALGMAISTAPLAFVTIATARRQQVPPPRRRQLTILFGVAVLAGTAVGFWGLRGQPEVVTLVLIALVSGFLITMITQTMIPEANREEEASSSAIFFVAGLSLYALLTLLGR